MREAIIICGSRNWTGYKPIQSLVASLPRGSVIIHGDARGADALAARAGDELGVVTVAMPAQWDRDGKGAGPRRNLAMAEMLRPMGRCGYVISVHAFPIGESRGTRHMIRCADGFGIPVHVYEVKP